MTRLAVNREEEVDPSIEHPSDAAESTFEDSGAPTGEVARDKGSR
jgi:hypothetical protein